MPRAQPPTAHTEWVGHAFRKKPSSPGLLLSSQKHSSHPLGDFLDGLCARSCQMELNARTPGDLRHHGFATEDGRDQP